MLLEAEPSNGVFGPFYHQANRRKRVPLALWNTTYSMQFIVAFSKSSCPVAYVSRGLTQHLHAPHKPAICGPITKPAAKGGTKKWYRWATQSPKPANRDRGLSFVDSWDPESDAN